MGFATDAVHCALEMSNNSQELALELLLQEPAKVQACVSERQRISEGDDGLAELVHSESFDRAVQEAADFQASHAAPRTQPPQYTRAAQPPQQQAQWQTARPAHDWADHGPERAWFLY